MGLIDVLFRRNAADAAPPSPASPKPKTYNVSSNSISQVLFGTIQRDVNRLENYWKIYQQGGIVCEAIDAYPLFVLSNGIDWEAGPDLSEAAAKSLIDEVTARYDKMNMETVMWQGIVSALVMNDAFQENVPSASGSLVQVAPRDPRNFEITLHPDTKEPIGYAFSPTGIGLASTKTKLELADITHLTIFQNIGQNYGSGLIERAYDDILRDVKVTEGSTTAIQRHGHPKYHIRVGTTGETVPETVITKINKEFEKIESKHEFTTVYDVDIKNIDSGGVMNVNDYNSFSVQRVCTALGVPEEVLGLGRGSTEATANVRLKAFYKKIAAIQKRVARCYNQNVTDRILKELGARPGSVRFFFNDVDPKDMAALATTYAQLRASSPLDPDAICPASYVREQLGIPDPEEVE